MAARGNVTKVCKIIRSPNWVVCRTHRFTESQNHRMLGVGRDLCGSPSPTPCPSRVTQSRMHRTLSRRVWNISREGDSTASLGSLGQGSVTLRGKKFFLMVLLAALDDKTCMSGQNKLDELMEGEFTVGYQTQGYHLPFPKSSRCSHWRRG